jgi:outer membrane protease
MKALFTTLFTVLILAGGPGIDAAVAFENHSVYVGPQWGYLYGDTTYHISQYFGSSGIESELEFPLQTALAGIALKYNSEDRREKLGLQVSLTWMTNIDKGSGKMKDSDWLTDDYDLELGAPHPGKDVYSESEIELQAQIFDLRAILAKDMGQSFNIGLMLGYRYQQFKYDVMNLNQVGYGPYAYVATVSVPGLVATYEVKYGIPYMGLAMDFKNRRLEGEITTQVRLGFSPFAFADDRDDHILRSKLSTCSANGPALLASVGTTWDISEAWRLELSGEYLNIWTDGVQKQYFYATTDEANAGRTFFINDEITSRQLSLMANLTFQFN